MRGGSGGALVAVWPGPLCPSPPASCCQSWYKTLAECENKADRIMWGYVKSLFLLSVLFKCLFPSVNLRLFSHKLPRLRASESVENKLGFSLSNAQNPLPRSKCLSSMFSKCVFFSFARYEGNKAIISASQNAVLIAAPLQMESERPGIVPN